MKNREEDLCFRRWQECRDADALGRVFDLTAPRLLLVALHVSQNSARAEDLVQTTFLQAMQGSARWDSSKGVFGWLSGILAHRGIDELRRARVRAEGALEEWQAEDSSRGPLQESLDRELVQEVAKEVDGLSDPYREVLILKLVHGLEPVEIAHTLKRAPGTVRMQLKRGLEKLRQDLPKGIALPSLLAIDPARGLESIKKLVMQKASTAQTLAIGNSANWIASGFGSPKIGLLSAVTLLLSIAGYWVWDSAISKESIRSTPRSSITGPSDTKKPSASPTTLKKPSEEGVESSRIPEGSGAIPAPIEAFQIRICYGNEDNPAVGVGISVRLDGDQGLGHQATSDEQGLAFFDDLASGRYRVVPDRGGALWLELSEQGSRNLLITLDVGVEVNGVVLDLNANPVLGAQIYRLTEDHPNYAQLLGTADTNGQFRIEHVPFETELIARTAGFQPSKERTVRRAHSPEVPLRLVLGAYGNFVSGSVVGPSERPLAFASILIAVDEDARETLEGLTTEQVIAHDAKSPSPLDREGIFVRTDSEGKFSTNEVPRGPATFLARGGLSDVPWIGFGTLDVRPEKENQITLQVGPGCEIYGRVQDTRGMPFANVRVHAEWKGDPTFGELEDRLGPLMANRQTTTNQDGDYRLRGLLPGQHDLSVGRRKKPMARNRAEVSGTVAQQWNVTLEPRSDLVVRLLDPAGRALENWGIRVAPSSHHGAPRDLGRTDATGRLRVRDLRYEPQAVCVHPPGSRADMPFGLHSHVIEGVLPAVDELLIQLPAERMPSARFVGQTVDARNQPLLGCTLRLTKTGQHGDEDFGSGARESTFQSPLLSAGTYNIELSKRDFAGVSFGPFTLSVGETKDLGLLSVPDPNFLKITLEHADGTPLRGLKAFIYQAQMGRSPRWPLKRRSGDPPNEWTSRALPDGSLTLVAFASNAAALRTTIDVRGGGLERHSFLLQPGLERELVVQYPKYIEGVSHRPSKNEARMDVKVIDEEGFEILKDRWGQAYDEPIKRIGRFKLRLLAGKYTLLLNDTDNWETTQHLQVEYNEELVGTPIHVEFL